MESLGISSTWPTGAPTNLPFRLLVPAPDTSSHQPRGEDRPLTLMSQRPLNWSSVVAAQQPIAQAARRTTRTGPTLPNFTQGCRRSRSLLRFGGGDLITQRLRDDPQAGGYADSARRDPRVAGRNH